MYSHEDLTSMTLSELTELKGMVEVASDKVRVTARKAAIDEIAQVAQKHGFSVEELFAAPGPKKRAAPTPKYRNSEDASVTWTGLGRHPQWVKAVIADGIDMETLRI
jgi:DNA-binding protein H-NS